MNEMYRAALELLRIVEHYDTEGAQAEREMATHILRDHSLPALCVGASRGPGRPMSAILGPRNSCVRQLAGDTVAYHEWVADRSPFGIWRDDEPLEYRPPELWVDKIHDACGGVE